MKLDDVLKVAAKASQAQDHSILFLDGAVEADHSAEYLRVYPDPGHRRSYLLVKKADVCGELHVWSAEEIRHAGFIGAKVFRIPLRVGIELQTVSVAVHKFGEASAARHGDDDCVPGEGPVQQVCDKKPHLPCC